MIPTLRQFYGLQPSPPADLFRFFVWEIVSEQALPARRDLAWQALRRLAALTPDAMFRAAAPDLLDAAGLAGPRRDERVERLRAVAGEFRRHRDRLHGERLARAGVLAARRALERVEHCSDSTRRRALLFALDYPVLPFDEDVGRVATRLIGAASRRTSPAKRWLRTQIATTLEARREAVIYLRHHAQQTCVRGAPHCTVCPLRADCASVQGCDTAP